MIYVSKVRVIGITIGWKHKTYSLILRPSLSGSTRMSFLIFGQACAYIIHFHLLWQLLADHKYEDLLLPVHLNFHVYGWWLGVLNLPGYQLLVYFVNLNQELLSDIARLEDQRDGLEAELKKVFFVCRNFLFKFHEIFFFLYWSLPLFMV